MKTLSAVLMFSLCMTTPLAAQMTDPPEARSKVEGLTIGVYLNGTALQVEDWRRSSRAAALSLRFGYGLNDNFDALR